MTVSEYIKTETEPAKLYDGIRKILIELDRRGRYPSDHIIKKYQREADARYIELTEQRGKAAR